MSQADFCLNIKISYYCQREYSFIFYIAGEELFIKEMLHLICYFPEIQQAIQEHRNTVAMKFKETPKIFRILVKCYWINRVITVQ